MKITCPYCRGKFNDYLETCPNCGAKNEGVVRTTNTQPQTIEELKKWYEDRQLPPYETTRFFIGIDYKEPRAFGIFKDENGLVTVYKNKTDGTRAIRYQGTDEPYAVNELYLRLKQEILHQKENNPENPTGKKKNKFKDGLLLGAAGAIIIASLVSQCANKIKQSNSPATGYFQCNNAYYYHISDNYDDYNGHWYEYVDDDWVPLEHDELPGELQSGAADDFYTTSTWDPSVQAKDFDRSDAKAAYDSNADAFSDDSSDDDYDWGSDDSWDSGDSNFDSDW